MLLIKLFKRVFMCAHRRWVKFNAVRSTHRTEFGGNEIRIIAQQSHILNSFGSQSCSVSPGGFCVGRIYAANEFVQGTLQGTCVRWGGDDVTRTQNDPDKRTWWCDCRRNANIKLAVYSRRKRKTTAITFRSFLPKGNPSGRLHVSISFPAAARSLLGHMECWNVARMSATHFLCTF